MGIGDDLKYKDSKFKFFSNCNLNFIFVLAEDYNLFRVPLLHKYYIFLDDKVFKKTKVTHFEKILRCYHHAYYFHEQACLYYDQFESFRGCQRTILSCPYELELTECKLYNRSIMSLPFHSREQDMLGLKGDFLSFDSEIIFDKSF